MAENTDSNSRRTFQCIKCGRRFNTQNSLQQHLCIMKNQSHEKAYSCDICDKCFYDEDHMKFHSCIEFGDSRYQLSRNKSLHPCTFLMFGSCHTGDKYKGEGDCTLNISSQSQELDKRNFTCNFCHENFVTKEKLNEHICKPKRRRKPTVAMATPQYSTIRETFYCQSCTECFTSEQELMNHSCFDKSDVVPNCSDSDNSNMFQTHLNEDKSPTYIVKQEINSLTSDSEEMNETLDTSNESCQMEYTLDKNQNGDTAAVKNEIHYSNGIRNQVHNYASKAGDFMGQNANINSSFMSKRGPFMNMTSLMARQRMHFPNLHPESEFSTRCKICNKIFSHKGNLKIHMRIHTEERPYKCQYCSKGFTMKQNMEIHIRTHTGEKPFKCDHCDHRFTTKQQMQKHMQNHTSVNTFGMMKQVRCIRCGMYQQDEDVHERICKFCWSSALDSTKGNNHEDIPNNVQVINLTQESSSDISLATVNFSSNKLHQIDGLNKALSVSSNHNNVGSSNHLFHSCDVCDKVFSNKASLFSHLLVHDGTKWFNCNFCNKQFRVKQTRDEHEREHTSSNPLQNTCVLCGKSFSSKEDLQNHNCICNTDIIP